MRSTTRPVDELYVWLLGQPKQLEPVYERLHQLGITDPTTAEATVEKITRIPRPAGRPPRLRPRPPPRRGLHLQGRTRPEPGASTIGWRGRDGIKQRERR